MKRQRRPRPARGPQPPAGSPLPSIAATRVRVVAVALLTGAALLAYWNSLSVPFHFDDFSPVENELIRQSADVGNVELPGLGVQVAGRPLVRASFALNYALGGADVLGYHVLNLAVHIGCALLLFALVRRTLERWSDGESKQSADAVALAAALIWALHPLNTGTVTYVSARSESLMALCYLAMLLAGLRAHDSNRRLLWNAVAVVACGLGMACKETMVTAPIAFVLFERAVVFRSFTSAFRGRWKLYASLAATWAVLIALAWSAPRAASVGLSLGVSPWTYLLNQAEIITEYLRVVTWPTRLVFAYGEPRAVTLTEVIPHALLIVSLLGLCLWGWHVRPKVALLGVLFFLILAPTSSVVPIATEVGAERRMYLPLAALVVLVVVSSRWAWSRLQPPDREGPSGTGVIAAVSVTATLCVALGFLTVRRNVEYASAETLWRTSLDRWPSALAHRNLATVLRNSGRREEAVQHLRATVVDHPEARYLVGLELFEMNQYAESLTELTRFLEAGAVPGSDVEANARLVAGRALAALGRSAEAVQELSRVAADRPTSAAQLAFADVLLGRQEFDSALSAYRKYVEAFPQHAGAWTNLGISALATGHVAEAIDAFQRVLELQPASAATHRNLATAFAEGGRIAEATAHAGKAAQLAPDDQKARDLYGRLLAGQGRYAEAEREFEAVLRTNPLNDEAREALNQLRKR
jgi:tetratricopeptide (TPR) repeat protein